MHEPYRIHFEEVRSLLQSQQAKKKEVKCKEGSITVSIDLSGKDAKIECEHPLIKLGNALPWPDFIDMVVEDLKKTTLPIFCRNSTISPTGRSSTGSKVRRRRTEGTSMRD